MKKLKEYIDNILIEKLKEYINNILIAIILIGIPLGTLYIVVRVKEIADALAFCLLVSLPILVIAGLPLAIMVHNSI
jgi:hypothetical protein